MRSVNFSLKRFFFCLRSNMHIFLCDPTLLSCDSYKAICLNVYCVDLVCLISRWFLFLLLSTDQLCWHLPRKALETSVVLLHFMMWKLVRSYTLKKRKRQCSKFNSQVIVERTQPIWKEQYTDSSKPIVFLFLVFKGFLANLTTGFFFFSLIRIC